MKTHQGRRRDSRKEGVVIVGLLMALAFLATVTLLPDKAGADFRVAFTGAVEEKPAVAFNPNTGEYLVAYLLEVADPFNPQHKWFELRVRRFKDGVQQGAVLEPLGSFSHEALGRPAIAYNQNAGMTGMFLVAVPERLTTHDRVIARFLDGNGNSLIGPDFLFDDSQNTFYAGNGQGTGPLRIVPHPVDSSFFVTAQFTVSGNNGVWGTRISYSQGITVSPMQLYNSGVNGFGSHAIAVADPLQGPVPPPGDPTLCLFTVDGSTKLMDASFHQITPVPLHLGQPEGNSREFDIAYGEVAGVKRFLLVYRDTDNCKPGTTVCSGDPLLEWSGIWGTYIDPNVTSYSGAENTPFPISKVYTHIAANQHMPRVSYNAQAKAFAVAWRELPGPDSDPERLSHIRANWVDYLVADGLYGTTLVPLPHKNITVSEVTGSCQTTWPFLCLSNEDPSFPDICPGAGTSAVIVWQQKYPPTPTDHDILGDLLPGGIHHPGYMGVFRSGSWYLDVANFGTWDGCATDFCGSFGLPTDVPVSGDWNGNGKTKIGVKRGEYWYLDYNGNGAWDGCTVDKCYKFGLASDLPVVGDWSGFGSDKIGVFRQGKWYLDYFGSGTWDGCGVDACIASFGLPGDIPVAGDWNGSGSVKIGIFRNGTWALDYDGSWTWNPAFDKVFTFGLPTDKPVAGDWEGDGTTEIGVKQGTSWYLDYGGDGAWSGCGADLCYTFGLAADKPVCGAW